MGKGQLQTEEPHVVHGRSREYSTLSFLRVHSAQMTHQNSREYRILHRNCLQVATGSEFSHSAPEKKKEEEEKSQKCWRLGIVGFKSPHKRISKGSLWIIGEMGENGTREGVRMQKVPGEVQIEAKCVLKDHTLCVGSGCLLYKCRKQNHLGWYGTEGDLLLRRRHTGRHLKENEEN
ncbi:hypothetical protein RUM44_010647 [Polyplax serrata]|uniref:Uncharacterized protein n=1 Tax=Polyplax serrata TaxID=468196 RepID=A0ABR1AMW1_POLSC